MSSGQPDQHPAPPWSGLTEREQEVMRCVVEGLANLVQGP
ncbi:MAG: hypothetical protein RLZZ180_1302 [Pseudomonadota bacterium]|jgi:DNA-binding NarL/FixJ family response regulator